MLNKAGLPKDWDTKTIGVSCDILDRMRIPVNSSDRFERKGDIPYYGANGLQGWIDDYIFDEELVLIAEDGGYFDEFEKRPIAYMIRGKSWVNNHAHVLRARKQITTNRWIYYNLVHKDIQYYIQGGTRSKLNQSELRNIEVPLPPLPEQSRIAEILDTIDEAIQKTEALISKLKAMKQGLLHDLLTRGLDKNGKLRDPKARPEQFKDSPVGMIPKEWEATMLRDEVDILHGYAFEGKYFSERPPGEVLLVPGNFHREGQLYFEKNNTKYFCGPIPKGTVLNNGDILIVMTDLSPRTLILGRVVQLEVPYRVLHNQRIGKIVFKNAETWCTRFFVAIMNDEKFRHNIIINATGTTVRHTSPDRILSNTIVKPRLDEQKRFAIVVDTYDARIRTEEQYRDKLKLQKKGLMHDLLTGKVRVRV